MRGRRPFLRGLCGVGAVGLAGCLDSIEPTRSQPVTPLADSELDLTSDAFADGETVPTRYTFDGADVSPPLSISGVPDAATSLVLIADDPDAPNPPFTHWLLWNLPVETSQLPDSIPQSRTLSAFEGAKQGTNSFGELGYLGPRPPEGDDPHTYRFTLYAVETPINVQAGSRRGRVDEALRENLVATARLTGEYQR